ncbi:MAG TPA: hypothetical protein VGN88_07490 [Phycisphaerae bacterium]|jgi:hypothetical protein
MDLFGLIVLVIVLIVVAAMQTGALLGIMFGLHKLYPDKLTETRYLEFDFDNFQKPAFQELVFKLAILFLSVTFALHMLDYLIIGAYIRKYRMIVCFTLFVLESSAIGTGLFMILKLDRFRLLVLTAGSAIFYMICLWYLATGKTFLA